MSSKKSKSRYSISYSEPSEGRVNIRPHGKTHHLFGSERFGQDNHRARAAPADSAAGILDLRPLRAHRAARSATAWTTISSRPTNSAGRSTKSVSSNGRRSMPAPATARCAANSTASGGKGIPFWFDVDVLGGINLKRIFGADACSVFIMPPSIEELERRLELRGTDAPEVIAKRVAKAEFGTDQGARIRPRRRQRRAGHGRGGGRTHRARLSQLNRSNS